MFLFVIAYLGGRADAPWAGGPPLLRTAAVVAAAALLVEIVVVLGLAWGDSSAEPAEVERLVRQPGRDRRALPHRSSARVRDHVDRAARRRDRRRRPRHDPREGETRDAGPGVGWYLIVAAILFAIGALGVMLRRSPLIVLLSLEIMLNAGEPRPHRLRAAARGPRRPGLRARGDGGRRGRGRVGLGLIVAMARRRLALDVDQASALRG